MEEVYNMNEKQVYTEVYFTLSRLSKDLIDKIPSELKDEIISKADTDYPYMIDSLLPKSKKIIDFIMDKYINV